jgi:hypothetical protein
VWKKERDFGNGFIASCRFQIKDDLKAARRRRRRRMDKNINMGRADWKQFYCELPISNQR